MKQPDFFQGAVVAAVLALLASVAVTALVPVLSHAVLFKLLIPALALAYILYLFSRCKEQLGRPTSLLLWLALAVSAWLIAPPLFAYVLLHVGAVWLIRSLYFYASPLSALLDLGLTALSLAGAYWAFSHSGSTLLTIWCFFLVQALFVGIPPAMTAPIHSRQKPAADTENFERARRRAESAIRQLTNKGVRA